MKTRMFFAFGSLVISSYSLPTTDQTRGTLACVFAQKKGASLSIRAVLRQNRRPDWSNMVGCQAICQFLDSFDISLFLCFLVLSQRPARPKLARVADQSARFPKSIGKGHPIAGVAKTSLFGKKEEKKTRKFSWSNQTRHYYETAISLRARIFLIPLAKYQASMIRLKHRDKLANKSLFATSSATRFAAPLGPGGNNNATCLVEGRE